ncbi:TlpA family protein disulfide reductase [Pedobacter sp. KLB.chiD]|uniref:TlpA family protein disulfide reductase n=1 Tax=Pedobacter sp. KLB.chiD TaxID=3387402 RepID=UPI00399963F9
MIKNIFKTFLLIIIALNLKAQDKKARQTAHVTFSYDDPLPTDNVKLTFFAHQWATSIYGVLQPNIIVGDSVANKFKIVFEKNEDLIFATFLHTNKFGAAIPILANYIIGKGDSVTVRITKFGTRFTGRGIEKYQCIYQIEQVLQVIEDRRTDSLNALFAANKEPDYTSLSSRKLMIKDNVERSANKKRVMVAILKKYEGKISNKILQLIKAEFLGRFERDKVDLAFRAYKTLADLPPNVVLNEKKEIEKLYDLKALADFSEFDPDVLEISNGYQYYLHERLRFRPDQQDFGDSFEIIKSNFSGNLRDKILTAYVVSSYHRRPDMPKLRNEILKLVKLDYCLEALNNIFGNRMPGAKAYDFALQDSNGNVVKLSDFKGKVVVMDFFFTGCTGCRWLNQQMANIYKQYQGNPKIAFVSVSIDKDINEWKASLQTNLYTHPHSINLYTNGLGTTHPIITHYGVVSYPTVIIINKDGKIANGNPPRPSTKLNEDMLIKILNDLI